MKIVIDMVVHGVSDIKIGQSVVVDGETLPAAIDCLEVELSHVGRHGSSTRRFVGKEAAAARELFKPDTIIEVEYRTKAPAPAEAAKDAA